MTNTSLGDEAGSLPCHQHRPFSRVVEHSGVEQASVVVVVIGAADFMNGGCFRISSLRRRKTFIPFRSFCRARTVR